MSSRQNWRLCVVGFVLVIFAVGAYADERTWTGSSGNFSVSAEFVRVRSGEAILRKSDGTEITVPLKQLSKEDRAYIKEQSRPGREANTQAKQIAEIAETFYSELRSPERDKASEILTSKAQELSKGAQSPLAGLPTPEPGGRTIRVGRVKVEGTMAEVPVQVRAGGTMHKTMLHLRQEDALWRVFALSAKYPDGERSINFEAAALPQGAGGNPLQAMVGKPFALEGLTMDGQPLDISRYQGKVVLVDFWATWCGPCRAEMPNVLANYQKHRDDGFDVIAVSVDQDLNSLKRFVEAEQPPWAVMADNHPGNRNSMAARYGIRSIPAFILVGKDGNVAAVNCRGPQLGQQLTQIFANDGERTSDAEVKVLR